MSVCAAVAVVAAAASSAHASAPSPDRGRSILWGDPGSADAAGAARTNAGLNAVSAIAADDVWAVGFREVGSRITTVQEHFDGRSWAEVPAPQPVGAVTSIFTGVDAISADNVWAVGEFHRSTGGGRSLIEHWTRTGWHRVPSPNPSTTGFGTTLTGVSAVSASDVWAVGYDDPPGPIDAHTLTLHWNGGSWSEIRTFNPQGVRRGFLGVSATGPTSAWAAGITIDPDTSRVRSLVEHWNGTRWNQAPIGSPGGASNILHGISIAAPGDVWAVGNSQATEGSRPEPLVDRLVAGQWRQVHPPGLGRVGFLSAVSADGPNDVWIVGFVSDANLLEHWDGHAWTSYRGVGATVPGGLYGVTARGTTATWAVGQHEVRGSFLPFEERWNGHVWTR